MESIRVRKNSIDLSGPPGRSGTAFLIPYYFFMISRAEINPSLLRFSPSAIVCSRYDVRSRPERRTGHRKGVGSVKFRAKYLLARICSVCLQPPSPRHVNPRSFGARPFVNWLRSYELVRPCERRVVRIKSDDIWNPAHGTAEPTAPALGQWYCHFKTTWYPTGS